MDKLNIENVNFVGYLMGGVIVLRLVFDVVLWINVVSLLCFFIILVMDFFGLLILLYIFYDGLCSLFVNIFVILFRVIVGKCYVN